MAASRLDNARNLLTFHGDTTHPDAGLVGHSPAMREALDRLQRVAPIDTTVLLIGETGTGKELMARVLHRRSMRATRPFVAVNLAAIPEPLVASELFGHEAGAFTGANQRRMGRFEIADHATLFLDEVGELSPDMQVALLRIVQEGEFERLGASQTRRVDVRLITATNRCLEEAVAQGRFREDFLHGNEQRMIQQALEETEGRVSGPSGAAARLGVPASTLESKIRRFQIDKLKYRGV